jgi:phosphoribosylpyrophosphate synthetase
LACLDASPIEQLITTDTVENTVAFQHPKVTVVSVSGLFAQAVEIIHTRASLSLLFD